MRWLKNTLRDLPSLLPARVTRFLRDTPAADIYRRLQYHIEDIVVRTFETPVGEIRLMVPREIADSYESYEPILVEELVESLSEDDIYYDVGAQVGYLCRIVKELGVPAEYIHAFESNRYFFNFLSENLSGDDYHLVHKRVGPETDGRALALDSYVNETNHPDVIKIDVDGFEYGVLRGMMSVLRRFGPTLYVEVHPDALVELDADESDLFELLHQTGYETEFVNHRTEGGEWVRDTSDIQYDTSTPSPTYLMRAEQRMKTERAQ